MRIERIFARLLASAALATVAAVPGAVHAQAANVATFDLPAQSLQASLRAVAQQTGANIVYAPDTVAGREAPALRGRLPVREAVSRLIGGTGIRLSVNADQTILLRPARAEAAPSREIPASGEGEAGSAAAAIGGADQDIVVTGSRLRRARGEEGVAPVTTFDRSRIAELGVSNVADIFAYLPQQPFAQNELQNLAGAREVRLRGLGTGTTLVLINGRRTVTSAIQASRSFFDLNTIPVSAVERVEILANSASAIYGADALGGVVNIVLRDSLARPQVDLYYGGADGGATERRASLAFGHDGDRWNAVVTLDYFDRDFLFGTERWFSADQDFRRVGGIDRRSAVANPGNITSSTTANLPGLSSRIAAVPAGSTGVGLTPASFAATAGQTNLESLAAFTSLMPRSRRYSAVAAADYEVTDGLRFFAEALFRHSRDESRLTPPSLSNRSVPASNAFNPFGVPVIVNFLLTGYTDNASTRETSDFYRGVAGFTAQFGRWDGEVSVLRIHETGAGISGNVINAARLTAALASSNPATALNPFQDGPGGSPELLASLLDPPRGSTYRSDALQAAFFIRGPLVRLPAGEIDVVLGAEAREEAVDLGLGTATGIVPVDARRGTEAAYGEMRIPLIDPDMNLPLVDRFTITLAARHDRYSDFGSTTNPQAGFAWQVARPLLLRGSWGESFRPPSLFQLYFPTTPVTASFPDPKRNNEVVPITVTGGGNLALEPERASALNMGALLTPGGRFDLRFGANWWRIRQELRILALSAGLVVNNPDLFPGRVVRDTPTAADIAAGRPGRLLRLDLTNANSGRLDTAGIDFEASGRVDTAIGAFSLNASATWVDYYRIADVPGQVQVDRVGVASPLNTVPRWRAVSTLGWSRTGATLALTLRWTASYADASNTNIRNGRRVPSQTLVDLDGSIDLGRMLGDATFMEGLVLRAGAKNLLNRAPSYSEVHAVFGIDTSQVDVRQRFLYVGLSKRF